MKILYLESIDSTQNYLKELVKTSKIEIPHAVVAKEQTDGIGSRGNSWSGLEGNLFLSFVLSVESLPPDLKIESSSIYFAYLLKELLSEMGSKVWLKWPNDFYIDDMKIGGMITNIIKNNIICGVGINLIKAPQGFEKLDIKVSLEDLLKKYFKKLEKNISWKQVFSKYELEFYRNKKFFTHSGTSKISLENVSLQCDGSILSNGERIFSLR